MFEPNSPDAASAPAIPTTPGSAPTRVAEPPARLPAWARDLHLCTGLFLSPFVLVFAVSTILLNHAWLPWEASPTGEAKAIRLGAEMPEGLDQLERARWVAAQAGVGGEIKSIQRRGDVVSVSVEVPGGHTTILADLAAGTAQIERRSVSLWDRLIYLHKTPGPHLAGFRGNWVFARIWRGLADGTVALLLFSGASGAYLWVLARAQRRAGLACAGAGVLTLALLVAAMAA